MTSATAAEIERKFEPVGELQLPRLDELAALADTAEFLLTATYYDTLHFALTRAHVVLRRRKGGTDEGWHVKLAGTDSEHREEHHAPVDSPRPPADLLKLVEGAGAGQAVAPVAQVRTRRRQSELRGGDGKLLAYLCDDRVEATVGSRTESWREAEVELVDGSLDFLDQVTAVFAAAGVVVSPQASKIGRTLAAAIAEDDRQAAGPASAGRVVLDYLSEQIGVLQTREADVRVDEPDAVHRSRVATRRLRSALRTFAPLFSKPGGESGSGQVAVSASRLRDELAWHASELGAARDAEVLRDGLLEALDALGVPAEAQERQLLREELTAQHARAHHDLVESMAIPRYGELHDALTGFLASPPLAAAAAERAAAELHGLLDKARGRVATLLADAFDEPDELSRWHEVRKAAKAVRYGSEALVPVFGDRAEAHAALWEAVTDALGQVQDSVVARQAVTQLAEERAAAGGEVGAFAQLLGFQAERGRTQLSLAHEALDAALTASL